MHCLCCGSTKTQERDVLWTDLINEWRIASYEVTYINRQQGFHCEECGANLRSMALAQAIMACYGCINRFTDFVGSTTARALRVLEINEAGALTQYLKVLPNYTFAPFPAVDMMNLPYKDTTFDLVVHSDTLEHVPHPVRGLSECRRILVPGGFCAFTIPMIVDRLTLSRAGLPPSYHGSPSNPADCLVHTEYGADAWKHVAVAGFRECRIVPLEYPAAQAFIAVR